MAADNDMTIREIRTTLLRMPWPDDPWLATTRSARRATWWWWRW